MSSEEPDPAEGAGGTAPEDLDELLQRGYRYALSLAHNPTEAEDLLQESCLKVVKARGPWHRGYLFSVIRNSFIDRWRREKKLAFASLSELTEDGNLDELPSILDEEMRLADKDLVESALARLRPEEREVLYLSALEGYTAQEISDLIGKPRGTVLSLAHRGKKKMAAYIKGREPEASS